LAYTEAQLRHALRERAKHLLGGAEIGGPQIGGGKAFRDVSKAVMALAADYRDSGMNRSQALKKAWQIIKAGGGAMIGEYALNVAKQISKIATPHIRKSGKAGKAVADVLDAVGMGRGRDRKPCRQNAELNALRRRAMNLARDLRDAGYVTSRALREAWKRV